MPDTVNIKRYASSGSEPVTLARLNSSDWTVEDLQRAARNHSIPLEGAKLKREIATKVFNELAKQDTKKSVEIERSVRIKLRGQGCNSSSEEVVTIKLVDPDTDDNGASQNEQKDRIVFETEGGEYFYTTVRDLAETLEALESVQYDTFGY